MNIIEHIKQWKKSFDAKKIERIEEEAKEIFQLKEYESQVWLTYRGALICPVRLIEGDTIVSLNVMRSMYIERAKKDEREN